MLFACLGLAIQGFSQSNVFKQQADLVIREHSGVFYDAGGDEMPAGNQRMLTTLVAPEEALEVYFKELNLAADAELRVFNGTNTDAPLISILKSGEKRENIKGSILTFEYIPSPSGQESKGWKAIFNSAKIVVPNEINSMPESDCPNAIPLCGNSTVVTLAGQYTDVGSINDDAGTCYSGTGSGGSVWYSFTPQSNGPLDFLINPTGSTDYDFVLWDITNGCSNKTEISCNFSADTGPTGLHDSNCNGDANCTCNNSKGASCNAYNPRPTVSTTKTYAICINFYSGANDGFILNFQNDPSSVAITDQTPPTVVNAYGNNCTNTTQLHITFSEWVQCNTIQANDFTLAGYTFGIVNTYCNNNRTNQVDISVSPALTSGTYTIAVANILDMCGNNMNSTFVVTLGTPPTPTVSTPTVVCRSPGFLGIGFTYTPSSQTLTAGGGTFYQWNGNVNSSSISVSPTATTVYTVTVVNGSCAATQTVQVVVEPTPTVSAAAAPSTVCPGASSVITTTVTGGTTYQWYQPPTGGSSFSSANSVTVNPTVATTYTVSVFSPNGCRTNRTVTVNVYPLPTVSAGANVGMCVGGSSVLNGSTTGTTYTWSPAGGLSCTNCLTPTASPAGTTTYSLSTTSAQGCVNTSTVSAVVADGPSATISATSPICSNTTASFTSQVLNAGSAPTYQWYLNGAAIAGATANAYTSPALTTSGGVYYLIVTPGGTGQCNNNDANSNAIAIQVNSCTNISTTATTVTLCNGTIYDNGGPSSNYTENTNLFSAQTTNYNFTINPGVPFTLNFSPYTFATNTSTSPADLLNIYNCNTNNCTTSPVTGSPFSGTNNPGTINIANANGARLHFACRAAAGLFQSVAAGWGANWYVPGISCSSITGPNVVSTGSSGTTYSVPAVSGVTNYIWTAPAGCVIASGQGTNSVTMNCNGAANSGNVTVTLSNPCNPACSSTLPVTLTTVLPVEITEMKAVCKSKKVQISWSTSSEVNSALFIVEKSIDAENWQILKTLNGAGNSYITKKYYVEDTEASGGTNYYRLKQVDYSGTVSTYKIVSARCIEGNANVNYFPNPFNTNFTVSFSNIESENASLMVYNSTGALVKDIRLTKSQLEGGELLLEMENLANGIYSVVFIADEFKEVSKLVKSE